MFYIELITKLYSSTPIQRFERTYVLPTTYESYYESWGLFNLFKSDDYSNILQMRDRERSTYNEQRTAYFSYDKVQNNVFLLLLLRDGEYGGHTSIYQI